MKALILKKPGNISSNLLSLVDLKKPKPSKNEVLVKVDMCGLCHTDLHIAKGELEQHKSPIILGHQAVGTVESTGESVKGFTKGDRVGVTWINSTCGKCKFCVLGLENLCDKAQFTGYDVNGGFAEYLTVNKEYAMKIPDSINNEHAAPLLCAGIIGYRGLLLSGINKKGTLGIFGFGASASIIIQIAKYWKCDIFVFTRSEKHKKLAKSLGATWVGSSEEKSPRKMNAAILTAPIGSLFPVALNNLEKNGTAVSINIHMSKIPEIDYNSQLYPERVMRGVANYTKKDAEGLLSFAEQIPIKTQIEKFKLKDVNKALQLLDKSEINGTAVVKI
jgi:alcohol dehydrogenase, propanol-preferring